MRNFHHRADCTQCDVTRAHACIRTSHWHYPHWDHSKTAQSHSRLAEGYIYSYLTLMVDRNPSRSCVEFRINIQVADLLAKCQLGWATFAWLTIILWRLYIASIFWPQETALMGNPLFDCPLTVLYPHIREMSQPTQAVVSTLKRKATKE